MVTADDDDDALFRDIAAAGQMANAAQNEGNPGFIRDMAARTADVINARLSDEKKQREGS
ncbi:hypothetical protein ACIO8F_32350 [Streptomyces sp. NPDC087228]|uniref:hypothetical protein n=1 Tax=Streptomyces sp. NPDC087228 TaxID=3365772 RepID=UPI00381652BC